MPRARRPMEFVMLVPAGIWSRSGCSGARTVAVKSVGASKHGILRWRQTLACRWPSPTLERRADPRAIYRSHETAYVNSRVAKPAAILRFQFNGRGRESHPSARRANRYDGSETKRIAVSKREFVVRTGPPKNQAAAVSASSRNFISSRAVTCSVAP